MAVAFDARTVSNVGSNASFAHTPVAAVVRGVSVKVALTNANDNVSAIAYGALSLTEVNGSPVDSVGAESLSVISFSAVPGDTIPQGVQTVNVTNSAGSPKTIICTTMTADGEIEVNDVQPIASGSLADPSATLSLGGVASYCIQAGGSGVGAVSGASPYSGWTSRNEVDAGARIALIYDYDTVGTADVTCGFDTAASADDVVLIAVAFSEVATAANDIAAALAAALTVAADLEATGALTAAQVLALTIAADLSAQGNITAAVSLILSVTANLRASGQLQAANTLQLAVLADLSGLGVLGASAAIALTVAADLNADGLLSAAASILLTVAASIGSAAGSDLEAAAQLALSVAANLSGQGRLSAAVAISATVTAALGGSVDALAANPTIALTVTADLVGAGEMQANPTLSLAAIADLSATGQVAAVLPIALLVAAGVNAPGKLTAAAQLVMSVAAGLTDANSANVVLAVRILVEARDRRVLVEPRERRAVIAPRRRRMNGDKLN